MPGPPPGPDAALLYGRAAHPAGELRPGARGGGGQPDAPRAVPPPAGRAGGAGREVCPPPTADWRPRNLIRG